MAHAQTRSPAPLVNINVTPLIDVLLVLLVMLAITLPASTNVLPVDLPSDGPIAPRLDVNRLVLTDGGEILWNESPLAYSELDAELRATARLRPQPELQFAPEPNASYDLAAHVMDRIKRDGITNFGFVGNERFRTFGKAGD